MTSYRTVSAPATASLEIKRSTFKCFIHPISDETEAREIIENVRKEHWDARHHCTAFIIGPPGEQIERSNDDGEPAGTAGAPMLEILRGREVSDVLAIVTRWFGGILLGAGGLTRAYGDSVREGLAASHIIERNLRQLITVALPHADAGRIEADMHGRGQVVGVEYGAQMYLTLGVPIGDVDTTLAHLAHLTQGQAEPQLGPREWV